MFSGGIKITILKTVRKSFHFVNIQSKVTPLSQLKPIPNKKEGEDFRIYLKNQTETISFWHDVNLKNIDNTYRMVVEIPLGQRAKMEMAKDEVDNPLKQDVKIKEGKKVLRFYPVDAIFNYGFLPQTWENPYENLIDTYKGDNDPIDVIELGTKPFKSGDIIDVYILGSFCLLDQNEIDWKVLVINREEAEKSFLTYYSKNYDDFFQKHVLKLQHWFKTYKTLEGKPENKIYFDNKFFLPKETEKVIFDSHTSYVKLKDRKLVGENIDYNKYNFDL